MNQVRYIVIIFIWCTTESIPIRDAVHFVGNGVLFKALYEVCYLIMNDSSGIKKKRNGSNSCN